MKSNGSLPIVALAGRPNVGKSTLFNRLLHKRRAITDPTPGVTRDPVAMATVMLGKPLTLVDTGGFKLELNRDPSAGELEKLVVEKTMEILDKADLIVLIFEAGNITLEDEEFIERLRPYQGKLIAAVNKTEGGRREAEAWNLLSYGFEKVHMISAEHGDNIAELEKEIVGRLPEEGQIQPLEADIRITASEVREDNLPQKADIRISASAVGESNLPQKADIRITSEAKKADIRITILGKPNTGKSTLSNRLTSSKASIVSEMPGTTRDVVEGSFTWKKHDFLVLDTAGIRRKSKVYENIEYYSVNRAIKSIDDADIVFLVIDAQEGLTDQDKKIAALAHDKGRGLIMALNKWDTMPAVKNTFEAIRDRIHFLFGQMEYAPIIALSALDGSGINELLNTSIRMYDQLNRHVETAALNSALEKWLAEYPPPSGPRTRFKIRYAVQKEANPVRFIFFASRHHAVGDNYIAYLRNRIRRDLGFSLVPVSIEIRPSSNPSRTAPPKKAQHEAGKRRTRKRRS